MKSKAVRYFALSAIAASLAFVYVNRDRAEDVQQAATKTPGGIELHPVQELVRGNGAEVGSLDPNKVEGVPGSNISRDLFETLIVQDAQGNIVPGVAERWESLDGNKTWRFYLRKDAKWSNGETVTAKDFVYSWQRAADPATASPYSWYVEMTAIENAAAIVAGDVAPSELGVRAVDDFTIEVKLDKPLPYFAQMVAHTTMAPIHQATVEAFGDKWTRPEHIVSNGAYKMSEWVVNEKVVLERNTNYWNDAKTIINKVTFLPIENETAELSRYKAGEVHITSTVPTEHIPSLQKDFPDELVISPYLGTYYYAFNVTKAPFDNAKLRKALTLSIDRDVITKSVTKAGQKPAYTFTPETVAGFNPAIPAYASWTQAERDAEAQRLFAEAGYGDEKPLEFELLYNTSEGHKKIALAVASMWKQKLGNVDVKLNNQEWKTYLDTTNQGDFTIARKGWIGDYNEASTMLDLGMSTHGNNDGGYVSEEFDKLITDAKEVATAEERNALYQRAEGILAEDLPYLPIYQYTKVSMVKPFVGGWATENVENKQYTRNMYIIKH